MAVLKCRVECIKLVQCGVPLHLDFSYNQTTVSVVIGSTYKFMFW